MKVVHIITSVKTGGAELMLLRLLKQLGKSGYDSHVVGLSSAGDISDQLTALGIPVDVLNSRRGVPDP